MKESCFFKAFKYSIPKILFGEESTLANLLILPRYIIKAFSLALGKETPVDNSWESNVLYAFGSSTRTWTISSKIEISPHSLPKHK